MKGMRSAPPKFALTSNLKPLFCSFVSLNLWHYNPRDHSSDLSMLRGSRNRKLTLAALSCVIHSNILRLDYQIYQSNLKFFYAYPNISGQRQLLLLNLWSVHRNLIVTLTLYHNHKAKSSMETDIYRPSRQGIQWVG